MEKLINIHLVNINNKTQGFLCKLIIKYLRKLMFSLKKSFHFNPQYFRANIITIIVRVQ